MNKRVEIDEAEFVRLSKLNNFAHNMLQNPDAAKLLEKAAKIVDPNIKTPRLDQDAAISTPMQKLHDEMAAMRKQMDDERAAAAQNQTLSALRSQREDGIRALRQKGWMSDAIAAVEKLMDEKGILDVEIAADHYAARHPPANVSMPGSAGGWGFMESLQDDSDADLKKLIETKGEQDAVVNHIAHKALNEFRSQSQGRR